MSQLYAHVLSFITLLCNFFKFKQNFLTLSSIAGLNCWPWNKSHTSLVSKTKKRKKQNLLTWVRPVLLAVLQDGSEQPFNLWICPGALPLVLVQENSGVLQTLLLSSRDWLTSFAWNFNALKVFFETKIKHLVLILIRG